MNLNAESYFSMTPSLDINRSRFDMSHSLHSSGNLGQLLPIEVTEVYPGDSFEYKTSAIFRLQPLVAPLMDDIVVDIFWFYAPMRILWEDTKAFFGENVNGPWAPQIEYEIPSVAYEPVDISSEYNDLDAGKTVYKIGTYHGSIADYMGLPTEIKVTNDGRASFKAAHPELIVAETDSLKGYNVSALPFRMYGMIYNEFFRSEALQNPLNIDISSGTIVGYSEAPETPDYVNDFTYGGDPLIACKKFDYFTGALPTAQRSVEPVMALPDSYVYFSSSYPTAVDTLDRHNAYYNKIADSNSSSRAQPMFKSNSSVSNMFDQGQPQNWKIDGVSVEQLRVAFQVQKFYEATARSGGRYRSVLESLFHVHASDQSMQIPQFLGSESFYLNINQVLQTSESGNTPQGNPAGISVTNHTDFDFMQSFTEHGFIMGLAVARYHHSYQQGIQRFWSREDKFDFYWPQFANIGEQPVLNKEIMCIGTDYDDGVFGYQEAWADLRYKPSIVTGEMRSNITNSMDMYHLADDYNKKVYLGDKWILEDKKNLDRCLAVTSEVANQFWFDMYFDVTATRALPVHSIPGLIDHH